MDWRRRRGGRHRDLYHRSRVKLGSGPERVLKAYLIGSPSIQELPIRNRATRRSPADVASGIVDHGDDESDEVDGVLEFYKSQLEEAGYEVNVSTYSSGEEECGYRDVVRSLKPTRRSTYVGRPPG